MLASSVVSKKKNTMLYVQKKEFFHPSLSMHDRNLHSSPADLSTKVLVTRYIKDMQLIWIKIQTIISITAKLKILTGKFNWNSGRAHE